MRMKRPGVIRLLAGFFCLSGLALAAAPQTGMTDKELAKALSQFKSSLPSFEKGKRLYDRGDAAGAARAFEACVRTLPGHIYAHYYLANISYIRRDYPEALRAIERAEESAGFMMAVDALAQREKTKEFDKMKKAIEDAYESTNSCRESRRLEQMYGQVFDEEGKAEMQAGLTKLHWRKLRSHYAYFHGNVLLQLKDYERAEEWYRKALEEDPQNGDAANNLSAIFFLAGRFEEAEKLILDAEASGAGDVVNLKLKALILEALGKPAEGILEEEYTAGNGEGIRAVRFTGNIFEGEANAPHLFAHGYVVFDPESRDALLVDPGRVDPRIEAFVEEKGLRVRMILNTHGHFDHTHGNVHYARLYGAPIASHRLEAPLYAEDPDGQCGKPDVLLEGPAVEAGTVSVRVYHTPGHTPGSVCFLAGSFLLSGDSLFAEGLGKISAANDADYQKKRKGLVRSLTETVLTLPPGTLVLPGHGPSSTLAEAREKNSSLR